MINNDNSQLKLLKTYLITTTKELRFCSCEINQPLRLGGGGGEGTTLRTGEGGGAGRRRGGGVGGRDARRRWGGGGGGGGGRPPKAPSTLLSKGGVTPSAPSPQVCIIIYTGQVKLVQSLLVWHAQPLHQGAAHARLSHFMQLRIF